MGRQKRSWDKTSYYHIVCRGNRRDPLFQDLGDFFAFFSILDRVYDKIPFELASYCLMTNHYHLQLKAPKEPIWKVMSLINKRYADYYNTKYCLSGHVFEKRYFSKVIDSNKGMIEVSCYIHLNPTKANMVKNPEDYLWSSYSYYKGERICPHVFFDKEAILKNYSGTMREKERQYCEEVLARLDKEESLE